MNMAKKIFKVAGGCLLVFLASYGIYKMWVIACEMMDSNNYFLVANGVFILILLSSIFLMVLVAAGVFIRAILCDKNKGGHDENPENNS